MSENEAGDSRACVEAACEQLRAGRGVVVFDDDDRENEGDLIYAAELMTPEAMTFLIRNTSGLVCVGMTAERLDALHLPLMVEAADDPRGTAFTVSVDLAGATSTGISAADRAATVRALADPAIGGDAFTRPGHIFPLRSRPGGVLQRSGHTEAAVDICRLAGLQPAGVLAELTNLDGTMSRMPDLRVFAQEHDLVLLSVADLVEYRMAQDSLVTPTAAATLPTAYGDFIACTYASEIDGLEHVAIMCGDPAGRRDVLVRVHSECLTGDVFGARRCDCGEQLQHALRRIAEEGCGIVVYLRGHEGRGIGIRHKLRAYQLQDDEGLDTVDANLALGLPVDSREYGVGAQILRHLGVSSIRLMTNNPAKYSGLAGYGLTISGRVPLQVTPNPTNAAYLRTKARRLSHQLDDLTDVEASPEVPPAPSTDRSSEVTTTAPELFRSAMSSFPSGVTIMTTVDRNGEPRGFAASSFCSLSMEPPLVLVCLGKNAQCHQAFLDNDSWAIHVVGDEHRELIQRFSTKGADKFAGGEFNLDEYGVPVLGDAPVLLQCSAEARHDGGDHTILIARVKDVALSDATPLLYFQREFHRTPRPAQTQVSS